MATRETSTVAAPGFIADEGSIVRKNGGIIIAWPLITDAYRIGAQTVKLASAAAIGADELTVDALPVALSAGQFLNFGEYAPVTVTVNDADVNATETGITVTALSGPIPAGTILEFSDGTYAELSADADAGATTLTVQALAADITDAATATFNGGTMQARVTAAADKGATTVAVDELQFGIADDAEAVVGGTGEKVIEPQAMVKVAAGDYAGQYVPRVIRPAAETAEGILETSAREGSVSATTGFGLIVGGAIYDNLLGVTPDGTVKSELKAAGSGFYFQTYADSRAS